MSRRMNACLEPVVCDDELQMEDPLLDEDKLEDAEEEDVVAEDGEMDAVESPWQAPRQAPASLPRRWTPPGCT